MPVITALTPVADSVPAAKAAGESVPEPVAAEKPQYIAPTLFGLEEETVRHRHKQRVIMSLYDTPAPAEKPTAPEVAETRPEPVATPEPKIEPAPAELERQQPEIRESHEFRHLGILLYAADRCRTGAKRYLLLRSYSQIRHEAHPRYFQQNTRIKIITD